MAAGAPAVNVSCSEQVLWSAGEHIRRTEVILAWSASTAASASSGGPARLAVLLAARHSLTCKSSGERGEAARGGERWPSLTYASGVKRWGAVGERREVARGGERWPCPDLCIRRGALGSEWRRDAGSRRRLRWRRGRGRLDGE